MNRTCQKCNKDFTKGTEQHDAIRLIGTCKPCTTPEEFAVLANRQEVDLRLEGISDTIARGVRSNVTSGPQQISLINIIRFGPCTVGEVAEAVGLDQSSITLHLKKFEHEGLVVVVPGKDKRQKIITATDKAREIYTPKA